MCIRDSKKKGRKVDEIKCGQLPRLAQYEAWRNTLFQNTDVASGRKDDKVLAWLQEVEDFEKYPEDARFAEEPDQRFYLLDKNLCAALQKAAHGELGRQITERVNQCMRAVPSRRARGRELLRIIVRYYQTNKTAEKAVSYTHLTLPTTPYV